MEYKFYSLILLIISFSVVFSINESVNNNSNIVSDESVAHIVFYGRCGCGKSFLCNRLKVYGQEEFIEG